MRFIHLPGEAPCIDSLTMVWEAEGQMRRRISGLRKGLRIRTGMAWLLLLTACAAGICEAPAAATAAFNAYVGKVESRLAEQHRSQKGFLVSAAPNSQTDVRLQRGELIIEPLTPASESGLPGAMLHHWRGTAFVRGARAGDFEHLMKGFSGYPQRFSPQVVRAGVDLPNGGQIPDHFTASMRVRQRHVITVVMDTTYDISYGRLDPQHGYSVSRSTHISEIASADTAKEHALGDDEEHGFLWRQNIYWSYEEHDGGLYMQVESISLTRAIPAGLGWIVRPYVESVPRESLEFTLRAASNALRS